MTWTCFANFVIIGSFLLYQCVDLVDTYGPEIIQALEDELNATAICDAIGLCQAKKWLTTTITTIKGIVCVIGMLIYHYF